MPRKALRTRLEMDAAAPLYRQVEKQILQCLAEGEWKPGGQLPTESQLAERFGAVTMTLEMPFKDHDDLPCAKQGWSPERSKLLARECLAALGEWLETREG